MDRSLIEGDPYGLIEGMIIGGYAIGASKGFVYVRAEYPIAIERLKAALDVCRKEGILGDNIFGSSFSFDIEIRIGAGAFVCGEETALMASIEGERGEPRQKPPFPFQKGLFGSPTIINNVESYANVPAIIQNGADWFRSYGTGKSQGTKVFALAGSVVNTGIVEVPMGITLRELVFDVGGGIIGGKKFKAAQLGGPSGGCLTESCLDESIDYDNLITLGAMMGSGGCIIMDEDTCMVDTARFFLDFIQDESCGKCVPCRIGTKRMIEMLDKICSGKGEEGDLERLEDLAGTLKSTALCALGQTAPNPVLSTLRYFRDEYEAHIHEKRCPAKRCVALLKFEVDPAICTKCGACFRACPAEAIAWKKKEPARIDREKCIKCMTCFEKCKFDAIS
jgi:NADP-reducing hydrogenase subunit HndC